MKFSTLAFVAVCSAVANAGPVTVKDCGVIQGADVAFSNFTVIPAIAQKGVPVLFLGNGTNSPSSYVSFYCRSPNDKRCMMSSCSPSRAAKALSLSVSTLSTSSRGNSILAERPRSPCPWASALSMVRRQVFWAFTPECVVMCPLPCHCRSDFRHLPPCPGRKLSSQFFRCTSDQQ